ncbi:MAG TPA: class I SAM-dependent methyltransferase [Acidimicrobiia bacterium]
MGYYHDQVLPRILNKAMDTKVERAARGRVCEGLLGQVVEIGFGSGLNAGYYPSAVTKVLAIEPSQVSMRLAESRIAGSSAEVELAGLDGQHLDLPSEQFDAVLSTWTLCTIPDLGVALAEIRRVLRPGGAFHFVEHGHAPDVGIARWQRRLEPLNKRLVGGCHLTRTIADDIERAGFVIEQLDKYYAKGAPKPWAYTFEGRARKS